MSQRFAPSSGLFAVPLLLLTVTPAFADACGNLAEIKLPDTTVKLAQTVAPGTLVPPLGMPAAVFHNMPSFCRVVLKIAPSSDSDIEVELWMPSTGWNRKVMGRGNGGFAGIISYAEMAGDVRHGFATVSTDTGHPGDLLHADWASGHPEKMIDYGYRAIHLMTVQAEALIQAFYSSPAKYSYFASCSNGGRQALMEAQRYPDDYQGLLAGAPANNWTNNLTGYIWNAQALTAAKDSLILPAKLPAISAAVVAACDAQDGLKDGVIQDPRTCHFDPAVLLCKGAETDQCLNADQVRALKTIYAGPKDPQGHPLYTGYMPGGELGPGGWAGWITAPEFGKSGQYLLGTQFFANIVYQNPKWDYRTLNFGGDIQSMNRTFAALLNANDPNLTAFANHGGKLILYQGWSDAAISPLNTLHYYQSVVSALGPRSKDAIALYMVPGMQHCDGGPGATDFGQHDLKYDPNTSIFSDLERWVETGVAPGAIVARHQDYPGSHATAPMTRLICPYPQTDHYKGAGNIWDAANFQCR